MRADAVVVTGPTTFRSSDGGMTFQPVATAPLGPVVASGGGFAAADCTTGGVAISGDGSAWTALAAVHPSGEVPVAGECGTIDVDDEGGVWLAATVGGEPVVYRVLDGAVDRLGVPVRPPGTIFAGLRLVAAAGGTVVAALGQPGGVAVSSASAVGLTTGLELDAAMTATTGAPPGHHVPVAVVRFDDRGVVAGVLTSPYVVDDPDGSYTWTTRAVAARLDESGRLELDERAAPIGADGNLGGIVTTPRGEVALATVPDPSPTPDAGSIGDVVVSRRVGSGWSARAPVLDGAGRQAVNAVVAAGTTVVGVGEQSSVDPATGAELLVPLVLVGDGSAFEPVPVEGAGAATLTAACQAPDGTVAGVRPRHCGGHQRRRRRRPGRTAGVGAPWPTGIATGRLRQHARRDLRRLRRRRDVDGRWRALRTARRAASGRARSPRWPPVRVRSPSPARRRSATASCCCSAQPAGRTGSMPGASPGRASTCRPAWSSVPLRSSCSASATGRRPRGGWIDDRGTRPTVVTSHDHEVLGRRHRRAHRTGLARRVRIRRRRRQRTPSPR